MPWQHTEPIMNQKIQFAFRAKSSENFSELCREYGISTKTGYKWKARNVHLAAFAPLVAVIARPTSASRRGLQCAFIHDSPDGAHLLSAAGRAGKTPTLHH
jgi:hypothetical protein